MLIASYKFRIGNCLEESKGFDEVQKKKTADITGSGRRFDF
jgi:hypothetical protein